MCSSPDRETPNASSLGSLLLVAALVASSLAATGCGKKGDPMPPLRNVPAQTRDFSLVQQGRELLFEMAYPATTSSGLALGGIDAVQMHLLTKPAPGGVAPEVDPREFENTAQLFSTFEGSDLEARIVGDRIQIRLPLDEDLPEEPVANVFAVRTVKGEETSAFSNRVVLIPADPPTPPANLDVVARPRGVELSWSAEGDPEGFEIFRRLSTERGYGEALRRVGGDQREILDRSARYGQRYIYTVRTVAGTDPLVLSDPAGEQEIEYEDRFPPDLPKNFVALPESGAVRLRWDPSPDEDVAGYLLYRRDPTRPDFVRVTPEPITATEFVDRGLASGLRFQYRLQVVDRSGNESPLSDPVAVTPR